MLRSLFLSFALLITGVAAAQTNNSGAAPDDTNLLPAPEQLSPFNNEELQDVSPYRAKFKWTTVPEALAYGIEIDCYGCCQEKHRWCSDINGSTHVEWMVRVPSYSFLFPRDKPGSWRVWAIDKDGRAGQISAWSVFAFQDAGKKNHFPNPPSANTFPPRPPLPFVRQSANPVDPETGEACAKPPLRQESGVTLPKGIYTPDPDYSESSRRWRVSGGATVLVEIGTDGVVKRACLVDAVQPDLGEEAVQKVKTWKFEPARKNGEAIPYSLNVEVSFNIYPWRMN